MHLDVSVPAEACPLNLAPTASTTAALAMGDALAVALLKHRGFTEADFARSHPGGALGRRLLLHVSDVMRRGDDLPMVQPETPLTEGLLEMSRKRLGLTAIVDDAGRVVGIFTDGDLRRALDRDLDIHATTMADVMTRGAALDRPARTRGRGRADDGEAFDQRPARARRIRRPGRCAERARPAARGGDVTTAAEVSLLVLDVDGVLTDGRLWYGPDGESLKVFDVRDGHGIKALIAAGIGVAVISGRRSAAVAARMRELGVSDVAQGVNDKSRALAELLKRNAIEAKHVACLVDDTPDLGLMAAVGLPAAVADAHPQVLAAARHVTRAAGGQGAVREFCDLLLAARGRQSMIARLLLLAGLVALIAALVQWRVLDREPAAVAEDATRPGYFLTGVVLEEFGTDGKLRIGLESKSATEDPASGVVRLADVAVDYHAPTGRLWHLTSNEARVPPGGRMVEFEGDVRLAGQPGEEPVAAELRTARLAARHRGRSRRHEGRPSNSPSARTACTRIGMRADLKTGNMQPGIRRQWPLHSVGSPSSPCCAALRSRGRAGPDAASCRSSSRASRRTSTARKAWSVFDGVTITQGEIRITAERAVASGLDFKDSRWEFNGTVRISMPESALASDTAEVRFAAARSQSATVTGEAGDLRAAARGRAVAKAAPTASTTTSSAAPWSSPAMPGCRTAAPKSPARRSSTAP